MREALGVLGGMGPLATADFLRKLTEATPASRDQEHIPTLIYSLPQIPDRSAGILGTGPSPLPLMLEGAAFLEASGAKAIAITCNTAHFWYDVLAERVGVPILHIADAVTRVLASEGGGRTPVVGLLAANGTIRAKIYQTRFDRRGARCLVPSEGELQTLVMPGIAAVKGGNLGDARRLLETAADRLIERGATKVIMACTEIPLALALASPGMRPRLVDATRALAEGCVHWWRSRPEIVHYADALQAFPREEAGPTWSSIG